MLFILSRHLEKNVNKELFQRLYKETTNKEWVYDFDQHYAETFAELIIKECAEICNRQANHYAETNNHGSAASVADALGRMIKMHFEEQE